MTEPQCKICLDEGFVCENHSDKAWNYGEPGCCGGAGKPCKCNKANPPWHFCITEIFTSMWTQELAGKIEAALDSHIATRETEQ